MRYQANEYAEHFLLFTTIHCIDSIYSFARSNEKMHAAYSCFSKRKARYVNVHFRVVEATGLALQRLMITANRVQCDRRSQARHRRGRHSRIRACADSNNPPFWADYLVESTGLEPVTPCL